MKVLKQILLNPLTISFTVGVLTTSILVHFFDNWGLLGLLSVPLSLLVMRLWKNTNI